MVRLFMALGSISGFIAVAAGAFAAHGLKAKISPEMLAIFETGARYQMYHALAMIAAAWCASMSGSRLAAAAGWLFFGGTVLFSGSLYALALTGVRMLGAITPFGGVMFLAGWICLAMAGMKRAK